MPIFRAWAFRKKYPMKNPYAFNLFELQINFCGLTPTLRLLIYKKGPYKLIEIKTALENEQKYIWQHAKTE